VSEVCSRCALDEDLTQWAEGADTRLGERGVNLSGGQRARVCLARALFSRAGVLLLDSPLSGLDASVGRRVLDAALIPAAGAALVVLVTHDVGVAARCGRVVLLGAGRVCFDGSPGQFRDTAQYAAYRAWASTHTSPRGGRAGGEGEGEGEAPAPPAKRLDAGHAPTARPLLIEADQKGGSLSDSLSDSGGGGGGRDVGHSGAQSSHIYLEYLRACGLSWCVGVASLSLLAYLLGGLADTLLARWADGRAGQGQGGEGGGGGAENQAGAAAAAAALPASLGGYAAIALAIVLLNAARYSAYSLLGLRASAALHARLSRAVLGARLSFFDTTPSGRIYSRYSLNIFEIQT
jgi:ATP-binding cassette subfamily C (CFTR/MRP) protein 1